MTYEINPQLVRTMAGSYDAAVAALASYDFPTTSMGAGTFGHVELAAWFSAVADQLDEAGRALYAGVTTMAENLRVAAHDAEAADDAAAQGLTIASHTPSSDLAGLLGPTRPAPPGQTRDGDGL